jgi:hypothetical protein
MDAKELVGRWWGASGSARASLHLEANGRFTLSIETPAGYMVDDEQSYAGRWEVSGDEIVFDLEEGDLRQATGVFHARREDVPAERRWRVGQRLPDGTLDIGVGPSLSRTGD